MQEHQLRDLVDQLRWVPERRKPLAGQLGANRLVVMEASPARRARNAGWPACRRRAARPPTAIPGRGLRSPGRWLDRGPAGCARRRPCADRARLRPCAARAARAGRRRRDRCRRAPPGRAGVPAPSSSLVSSPETRSAVMRPSSPAIDDIAARTSGAIVTPSVDTKRAARSMRSGSSANDSSGVLGVRSTPRARSASPPYGSLNCRHRSPTKPWRSS